MVYGHNWLNTGTGSPVRGHDARGIVDPAHPLWRHEGGGGRKTSLAAGLRFLLNRLELLRAGLQAPCSVLQRGR
jgi:hypothetical protein